jgi:hypothetical protein
MEADHDTTSECLQQAHSKHTSELYGSTKVRKKESGMVGACLQPIF